jgi:Polyketide cyclase / dehydrase and lipid transport
MRSAHAEAAIALDPPSTLRLWTDLGRWPSFVEGFGHPLEVAPEWPSEGAKLVWESRPGGRGCVTERVVESGEARFATQVFEKALAGTQTLTALADPEGGSRVELRLDYELARPGPLRALADVLFIRRALRDALRRTLRRFAVEAEEEAGLR